MADLRTVCVFCGSSFGVRAEYVAAARALAAELAARGMGLVYGGGNVGLMGVVSDAALEAGVHVTGVIPQALADSELAHYGVSDLRIVASMHARKALMADLSDGFIAMPGGIGTFEEFFEILTWNQLGIHRKPCGLLDVQGYYQDVLRLLDRAQAEGFYKARHRTAVLVAEEPAALLDLMLGYEPAAGPAVIDKLES